MHEDIDNKTILPIDDLPIDMAIPILVDDRIWWTSKTENKIIKVVHSTEGWEGDFASVMKWHMLGFKYWQIWYQMKAWNLRDPDLIKFLWNS